MGVNAFRELMVLTIEGQIAVTPAYLIRRGRHKTTDKRE